MASPSSPLASCAPQRLPVDPDSHGRLAGSNFAQLVSKFEILDAMSSVDQRRDSRASPKTHPSPKSGPEPAINSSVPIAQNLPRLLKQSSQGSAKTRGRSSTESSHVSPGHFVTPRQKSPRLRRAQTLVSRSPATASDSPALRSRQKSVAERRKMFETQGSMASVSPLRTSTLARPTSKLAHSKSWRSIKTRRSAPEPRVGKMASPPASPSAGASRDQQLGSSDRDLNPQSGLLPSSRAEIPSPRSLIASNDPFGAWRTPMSRPDDSWSALKRDSFVVTASDMSPSCIRSQYIERGPPTTHAVWTDDAPSVSPPNLHLLEKQSSSVEDPRQQGWIQNARKMATSLSNSMGTGSSSLRTFSPQSQEPPRHASDGLGALRSFRLGRTTLPRSRISSLRRKFDLPKSQSMASLPGSDATRRKTNLSKDEASGWPSKLSLHKSSTTSNLAAVGSLKERSKSYAPGWAKMPDESPGTPMARRKTEKNISPLKQKIDLFESLDSQGPGSDSVDPLHGKIGFPARKINKDPDGARLKGVKGTLRRISAACRRSSSEWSGTSPRELRGPRGNSPRPIQTNNFDRAVEETKELQLSPRTFDSIPERPALGQTFLANEISPLALDYQFSLHRSSLAHTGYNVDGEAGLGEMGAAPRPLFSRSLSRSPKTKFPRPRNANRFSLTDLDDGRGEHHTARRQSLHRRSSPLISKAHCQLEQPRPIRANELRRLVSLCKERVRKLPGGRSE